MSIQDVFNVPNSPSELARWSVLHMILHRSQNLAAFRIYNTLLAEYVLDPIDPSPNSMWFQQHQQMHNDLDGVIGVAQFDLLDVDFTQLTQRVSWIQSHAQLHQQETDILGIFS